MTATQTDTLPPVATLWIGARLGWIDELMLNSFRAHGHAVTLFVGPEFEGTAPEGIDVRSFLDIWPEGATFLGRVKPATVADLFRIKLMNETDFIWADSDVIALQPLMPKDGYLIGYEDKHSINNAVMRLPKASPARAILSQITSPGAPIPPWMEGDVDPALSDAPYDEIITAVSAQKINAYGPLAMTSVMKETGEHVHALPRRFLSPLPWKFSDVVFNPGGGVDYWLSGDTLAIHLYGSRVRFRHKQHGPPTGSFLHGIKTVVEKELGI